MKEIVHVLIKAECLCNIGTICSSLSWVSFFPLAMGSMITGKLNGMYVLS